MTVTVAVYHERLTYGGPEEGGWYYDEGNIRFIVKRFRGPHALVRARKLVRSINDQFYMRDRKQRRRDYHSVLSTGREVARCFTGRPVDHYPEELPYYC